MTAPAEALIFDAIRTPRGLGKPRGSLHEVKPVDLLGGLLDSLRERHPEMDPAGIEDIVLGCVTPVGDQGADIARTAAIKAGMPEGVAGVQLNRFCGSGLEAVNQVAARVRSGWESLLIGGGVESMSRVPMASDGGAWAMDPATAIATDFIPQGISADLIATREGFTRRELDEFAVQSHQRAARAWEDGRFSGSVIPVKDQNGLQVLDRDETIRPEATVESLAELNPAFAKVGEAGGFDFIAANRYPEIERVEHLHHAGSSSGIVDGAALVLVGSQEAGQRHGLRPRARIVSTAVVGSEPTIMLTGPTPACRKALDVAGLSASDIDLVEINEAFAAIPLKLLRDMGWSQEQTNVNGGAIAMGHPLGATGAMILGTLVDELERRDLEHGIATLCIGGGMGIATVVQRI
ncbi:acetyl-CoA C-acetyltransferase [Kocuria palustris]|uniref:acetyl-CoA C-acetyltransferase n=1 Tax=Kocuria palustris TaxID=71999 RepID=UPI002469399C|nr:acetyl-CoA C-acetyltransferase [Kocuria palustris]MDH5151113.1 acetyl-CoA C-acetyltransferase [Kocuria palustris]